MLRSLTIIAMIAFFAAALISADEPKHLIYHDGNYKLKWKDFQGEVEDGFEGFTAVSYVGFRFGYKGTAHQDSLQVVVEAFFNPENSWHRNDTSKAILQHEQIHFDITELYSRKLKQRITQSTLTYKNYQQAMRDMEKEVRAAMNTADSIYDATTDNGLIKAEQATWNTNIAADLENLKVFEPDTFYVPVHL
ncbi:MAG TPA: hypothetical protein PLL28_11375 [Chitinophagales bacterium]|nr:hypothetical protein [Chitinophagales bacterium]HNF69968.1 hypothetical protein [Chitinophagales bacterium]HNJ90352.1 hypothetical protein [Chitinophagales bacterium]HNM08907.1 hypothetical protein [Chitinophagales bacterium]HNM30141.1 hypothetical protein [Chitinophagales bacterium]